MIEPPHADDGRDSFTPMPVNIEEDFQAIRQHLTKLHDAMLTTLRQDTPSCLNQALPSFHVQAVPKTLPSRERSVSPSSCRRKHTPEARGVLDQVYTNSEHCLGKIPNKGSDEVSSDKDTSSSRRIVHSVREKETPLDMTRTSTTASRASLALCKRNSSVHQRKSRRKPQSRESRCRRHILRIVDTPWFDVLSCFLVLSNACYVAMETDRMARDLAMSPPVGSQIVGVIFCSLFCVEILIRILAFRSQFLFGEGWQWNLMDFLLVGLQVAEVFLEHFLGVLIASYRFSFMRILRLLRLVKIIRIVRVIRFISELRTLLSTIVGSIKSLLWTIAFLMLMIFIVGVVLTQVVLDVRLENTTNPTLFESSPNSAFQRSVDRVNASHALELYYGSLFRSILSLYQSISGGMDWSALVDPLITQVSPFMGFLFALYVAFSVLVLMNVVTSVFVESALKCAKDDRESYLTAHVRKLFGDVGAADGKIDWEAFRRQLGKPHTQQFFQILDVDISEARGVFRLLDVDGSGSVGLDEFLSGCLGLHGPAKAIDLATLMYETRGLADDFCKQTDSIRSSLDELVRMLGRPEEGFGLTPKKDQSLCVSRSMGFDVNGESCDAKPRASKRRSLFSKGDDERWEGSARAETQVSHPALDGSRCVGILSSLICSEPSDDASLVNRLSDRARKFFSRGTSATSVIPANFKDSVLSIVTHEEHGQEDSMQAGVCSGLADSSSESSSLGGRLSSDASPHFNMPYRNETPAP
eukprot:TRINITY_DN3729_c0_g1_i9.p1 TRINITY_DN3729_c0_g1~~TRINITY_DN3729_c0_g1_i9.p1  ORF type:complete len:754 (+),score=82.25 TRINITY_DN3729_c0_g1_i9:60-2321(+)